MPYGFTGASFHDLSLTSHRYFQEIQNPTYGNCFTFNTELNIQNDPEAGQRTLGQTGPKLGLHIVLDLDQDNYMTSSEKAGGILSIHSSRKAPNMEETGMEMMPGTSTEVALHHSEIIRCVATSTKKIAP